MKAIEIIRRSMRLIGALGVGEVPTAEETSDCLLAMNQLLSSWSVDALTIYVKKLEKFTLTPGQPSYTYGPTGDFDSERPDKIEKAYYIYANELNEIAMVNDETFLSLVNSAQTGVMAYCNYSPSFPLGKVSFLPIPNGAFEVQFLIAKKLTYIKSSDDEIDLPPSYERALSFNLAVELAPEFGLQIPVMVERVAVESLANVKRMNIRPTTLRTEIPFLTDIQNRGYNISKG